jgi:ribosomal RNA assembly protein
MIEYIAIPKERISILRSKDKMLRKIEDFSQTKITLGEEVEIESDDVLKVLRAKEVIRAFGRGFGLEDALNLLDDTFYLDTIDVGDFSGKSKERMITLKGRVIGKEGKIKQVIEKYTDVKIAVYGKTIGIIGYWNSVLLARKAVEMLLQGSLHSSIYKFLQRNRVK